MINFLESQTVHRLNSDLSPSFQRVFQFAFPPLASCRNPDMRFGHVLPRYFSLGNHAAFEWVVFDRCGYGLVFISVDHQAYSSPPFCGRSYTAVLDVNLHHCSKLEALLISTFSALL
ncbi:hypothetical protein VKT23_013984 [Stygiomarasmius scandens]|uniref:Uncharacterized protein n=1 Tax=Marasmiellus scandens TaxID=2682957 RepID=A0ABR1J6C2_9AGAR